MARYYFHLWTGKDYEVDAIGVDLADADLACVEAYRAVRDLCADGLPVRRNLSKHRFEITDDAGRKLFDVPFSEVLGGEPPSQLAHEVLAANMDRVRQVSIALKEAIENARQTMRASKEVLARSQHDPKS